MQGLSSEVEIAIIGGLCTVLGYLFSYVTHRQDRKLKREDIKTEEMKRQEKKLNAVINADKTVIMFVIRYVGRDYLKDGEITLEQKETLADLHRAYKGLGGNGDLDTIMEELDEIDISV